jgi:hypothetical protein
MFFNALAYSKFTGKKLNYKENYQITDLDFLLSFQNSNEYNIDVFKGRHK